MPSPRYTLFFSALFTLYIPASAVNGAAVDHDIEHRNIPLNYVSTKDNSTNAPQIVDGSVAGPHDHSFQVAILYKDPEPGVSHLICGGSLINRQYIVTAAHCGITQTPEKSVVLRPDQMQVLAGTRNLSTGGERRDVLSIVRHPKFDHTKVFYDVAVWKLQQPIDGVLFPTLAPSDGVPGTMLMVTGWGATDRQHMQYPDVLQKFSLPSISHQECTQRYGDMPSALLCAGFGSDGRGVCYRDSGGPATQGAANTILTGIVSHIRTDNGECARPGEYDMFVRVSDPEIRNFIINNSR